MCGIVGLHLKNHDLAARLGEMLTVMLQAMTTRGPDSAGLAVYADDGPGSRERSLQYSLRTSETVDWDLLAKDIAAALAHDVGAGPASTASAVTARRLADDSAVLISPADESAFLGALRRVAPGVAVAGYGRAMLVVKDVGAPAAICARYGVPGWAGYQGIGHTRMATESAVTTAHSHPFAPAADLALVHNGSFSNYATVRRRLARSGVRCDTDNDSEVAARLVALRTAQGAGLDDALRYVMKEMDGFFTLLVATRTQFAVVRDSFACKPAVIAQTGDYVAMASEYQALARLPGIAGAEVFEPAPEEIYIWNR
jgi:methylamine---glutamate N-methyltransferase subunit A